MIRESRQRICSRIRLIPRFRSLLVCCHCEPLWRRCRQRQIINRAKRARRLHRWNRTIRLVLVWSERMAHRSRMPWYCRKSKTAITTTRAQTPYATYGYEQQRRNAWKVASDSFRIRLRDCRRRKSRIIDSDTQLRFENEISLSRDAILSHLDALRYSWKWGSSISMIRWYSSRFSQTLNDRLKQVKNIFCRHISNSVVLHLGYHLAICTVREINLKCMYINRNINRNVCL